MNSFGIRVMSGTHRRNCRKDIEVSDVIKKLIVTQICNARLEKKIVELDKKIKEYET